MRGPAPVLLVHPGETPDGQGPRPALKRILIPLDGSELAERVLEPAIDIGTLAGAVYTLIHIADPGSPLDGFAAVTEPRHRIWVCATKVHGSDLSRSSG